MAQRTVYNLVKRKRRVEKQASWFSRQLNITAMKEHVPVSVVIPCYQCRDTIWRAVKSVYQQTRRPMEVILVDDGSLDQTPCALKKVQEYFGENWIKIITLDENSGPSLARNKAWDNASGVFIAFLDADDAWKATKIEIQYNVMIHNPEYPISCHEWHLAADREIEEQKTADTVQNYPVKTMSILSVLMSNRLNTSSVMLRSDIQHRFCIEKRHSEDYLLWMEILLAENAKALMINRPLVVHFKSPFSSGGQSADLCKMEMEELNNFKRIFKTGKIPCGIVILAMMFSCIKYLRRLLIVKFSNAR